MFHKVPSKGRNTGAAAHGDVFADGFWRPKPRSRSDSPAKSRSRDPGMWSRASGWRDCRTVQINCSVVSDSLRPHESQHTRPPCPSPTPGAYANSYPSSWWCHPAISSSVVPFSSCPQSLPASGSFPMSQPFAWGGQSFGVSALASVFPMNTAIKRC